MQHKLGLIDQIPLGEGREFIVSNEEIAVFRLRSGDVFATQALCPHQGASLCDGITGGTTVICPFHSWKFDLASGAAILGSCDLKTYPVSVGPDGAIEVTVLGGAQ